MINIIKANMDERAFAHFMRDFERLYICKNDASLWRKAFSKRTNEPPIYKDYFDVLASPFDYCTYKSMILDTFNIEYSIEQIEDEALKEALTLFYTIDTYIGFIVEHILYKKALSITDDVLKDNELDRIKKVDLMINNRQFQIKNLSFIDYYCLNNNLDYFLRANPQLNFIFYRQTKDNLYFVTLNDLPFVFISELKELSAFCLPKNITIDNYAEMVCAAAVNNN